jgi:dipeptidyl aminopeptidase/acylaminoacyl peptidase
VIDRRRFSRLALGATAFSLARPNGGTAQEARVEGKIAYIKDGNVWAWRSDAGAQRIVEDGAAMDPTWEPGTEYLLYARNGGSFTNLILANTATGRTRRLTDNESGWEVGSPDYVADSVWAIDPSWSPSGIVCYASNQESPFGDLLLWILDPAAETTYPAASDGMEEGSIEHISVDANGIYAVYTVLVGGWGGGSTTYISMRDLNTGATYPLIEGPQGAYDPAISPDGAWVVATLRDENGMSDLWLCNREDETLTPLTSGEQASNATWSPDGEWVAYLRMVGSKFELRALQLDLGARAVVGKSRKLTDAEDIDSSCGLSWSTL